MPKPSPNGVNLAFVSSPSQGVWQLSVLQPNGTIRPLDPQGGQAYWSPNGRWLAYRTRYESDDRAISVKAVEAGNWSSRVLGLTYPCQCDWGLDLLWSADSRWLVYRYAVERTTFAVDVTSGSRAEFGPGAVPKAWAPQGATLATIEGGALVLHDMDAGTTTMVGQQAVDGSEVVWSPDGQAIAYPQQRNGGRWLGVVDRLGKELIQVPEEAVPIGWSGDSTHVAVFPNRRSTPGGVDIYDIVTGKKRETVQNAAGRAAWSPVGSVIAYTALPKDATPCRQPDDIRLRQVRLRDVSTGGERLLGTIETVCRGSGPDLLWSADGRFLAICEGCMLGL